MTAENLGWSFTVGAGEPEAGHMTQVRRRRPEKSMEVIYSFTLRAHVS